VGQPRFGKTVLDEVAVAHPRRASRCAGLPLRRARRLEATAAGWILNRYRADVQIDLGLLSDWKRADRCPA
jgi:hypothetical protein